MAYGPETNDPFSGGEKVPSLSWKGLPIGSTFKLEVLEPAKKLQQRDFEKNEPAYWDAEKTQPKEAAVVNVRVLDGPHSVGEDRSIWASIPSNLFVAIKDAQKQADARVAPGGILYLRFDGEVPHENKKYNAIKQYKAKYEPPTGGSGPDPFAQPSTPAQPQQQPAQAHQSAWNIPSQEKPQPATAGTGGKPRW